jgi:MoaA/NifB/PqqE/SkfB family radical SAM enzyme
MQLELFEKIIDNSGFPGKVKVLHLYNVGEPLININLCDMISHAKGKQFSERISLVTNASLLDQWVTYPLLASGLDRIIISLYGLSDEDYLKNTNRPIKFESIYENIKFLHKVNERLHDSCEVFIKVIDRAVPTKEALEKFVKLFAPLCDYYSVEPVLPIWPNFQTGEVDKGLYEGIPAKERIACHYPFYSLVVDSAGIVNPCLADWDGLVQLGDAKVDSLNTIWNSDKYEHFRFVQLCGYRKCYPPFPRYSDLCATCGTLKAATMPEDDIDDDRIRLRELYANKHRRRASWANSISTEGKES